MNPLILMPALQELIGGAIGKAVREVSRDPSVPLPEVSAPAVAAEVAGKVVDILQSDPRVKDLEDRIAHVASSEAWYQSRANWSAIIAGLTPLAALAGYNLAAEDQVVVAGVLAFVGNAIASYLARRARTATKPLGAK